MIKKTDIEMWKKKLPQDFERMAIKYLTKRVNTYINAVTSHSSDENTAKADIYRHLIRHTQQIIKLIDKIEKELIDLNVEIYFPYSEEKVYVKNREVIIEDMKTKKDWSRAYVQDYFNKAEKEKK